MGEESQSFSLTQTDKFFSYHKTYPYPGGRDLSGLPFHEESDANLRHNAETLRLFDSRTVLYGRVRYI
jgi:hypothetical protein